MLDGKGKAPCVFDVDQSLNGMMGERLGSKMQSQLVLPCLEGEAERLE